MNYILVFLILIFSFFTKHAMADQEDIIISLGNRALGQGQTNSSWIWTEGGIKTPYFKVQFAEKEQDYQIALYTNEGLLLRKNANFSSLDYTHLLYAAFISSHECPSKIIFSKNVFQFRKMLVSKCAGPDIVLDVFDIATESKIISFIKYEAENKRIHKNFRFLDLKFNYIDSSLSFLQWNGNLVKKISLSRKESTDLYYALKTVSKNCPIKIAFANTTLRYLGFSSKCST